MCRRFNGVPRCSRGNARCQTRLCFVRDRLISFRKIKTMDFSSLIEIINKALTNDEAEQQDEKRNCPNPLSIRSLLIFVLSHITCAIICYQILINIHNLFNVVMDICTGTRRPAADDSLTNESRVDSPKFDYIVSNNNAFTDLAKKSAIFLDKH